MQWHPMSLDDPISLSRREWEDQKAANAATAGIVVQVAGQLQLLTGVVKSLTDAQTRRQGQADLWKILGAVFLGAVSTLGVCAAVWKLFLR
jgi:hypothetical protein